MKKQHTEATVLAGIYPETYFAGANTARGFISAYGAMIDETKLTRVYILKGGSGTGKSTLMKKCAAAAEAAGASVTMLLCSSDPASADAVILRGKGEGSVAIVDGTAPHTLDPLLPGAVGEIVNLGDFWRPDDLQSGREEIALHTVGKKEAYARAYRFLAAYGEITGAVRELLAGCLLHDKMEAAAKRLVSAFPREEIREERLRYTSAVSMTGVYRLCTFTRMAKKTYAVADVYGCGSFFLDAIRRAAGERRCTLWYAPAPGEVSVLQEVYSPSASAAVAVTKAAEAKESEAVVNMQRFLDRRALASCRGRLRFAGRCADMLMEGALDALEEARLHHFALEEIYRSAMDFEALGLYAAEMTEEIVGILH